MTIVILAKPFTHDGQTWTELDIDEPTVGAIEAFENAKTAGKSDMSAMIDMLAHDLDIPVDAVRRIRASDMAKISEVMGPLAEGLGTGAPGAPSSQNAPTS